MLTLFSTFSSLSESFFMVKGAALFLQQGGNAEEPKTPTHHKHAGRSRLHIRLSLLLLSIPWAHFNSDQNNFLYWLCCVGLSVFILT